MNLVQSIAHQINQMNNLVIIRVYKEEILRLSEEKPSL